MRSSDGCPSDRRRIYLQRAGDRRSAGQGATARAGAGAWRRRLRDTVRLDRRDRSSHRRGAVAAQRGCRCQGRDVEHPSDQVRQVATGADAPQHRKRVASVSLDARPGGRVSLPRKMRRSPSAREAEGRGCHWATVRSIASLADCVGNWVGATAELTMPRASTTCGTPSSCAVSCSGKPRAWTSIRPCCRCRPASAMRW